jgi:inhibitor of KinA
MAVPTLIAASDHSLLVSFGHEVSREIHRDVLRLSVLLRGRKELLNIHPAYCSVLISYDPRRWEPAAIESLVRESLARMSAIKLPAPRTVEVPVHYGGADSPDLADVAQLHSMTPADVVRIHSSAEYIVYFLGFSPGFPYLGGLPPELATPRLPAPRRLVPAGSVAIGGEHTGIYTVASPGGWRIIGRTPLEIFRADRNPIALLQMGDCVRFVAI